MAKANAGAKPRKGKIASGKLTFGFAVGAVAIIAAIVILIAIGYSQQNHNYVQAELGKDFQLSVNESAYIGSENLAVKFLGVKEDSRCPEGAMCIWAGRAVAAFALEKNGAGMGTVDIEAGKGITTDNGYVVELVELGPHAKVGERVDRGEYVATLRVSTQ